MLKKLLFKKEWEKIEKEKEKLISQLGKIEELQFEIKKEYKENKEAIQKEKDEVQDKYERQLKVYARKKLKEYQKKLQEIYDYKIFPGAKVWVFEGFGTLSSKPVEVEIERVIFEKDKIRIDDYTRFFFTEQEAIKTHNKEIKKLLLK